MFRQLKQLCEHTLVTGLVVALASTFMACSFKSPIALDTPEGINHIMNTAPPRSLDEGNRWTVYEDPGKIRVQHGFGCLQQGFAATEDYVGFRIQDTVTVPLDVADAGTVILNGWDVQYLNSDHHLLGLGSAIFNITEAINAGQFELSWEAGGVLSDNNGNDSYKWCYRYTLVLWRRGAFDAVVSPQDDVPTTFVGWGTALSELHGKFTDLAYGAPRAVLPRGLGLTWHHSDHHVMQFGFDLGTPPLGGTPVITGNEITWTSQMILKDKSSGHAYNAAELVTILSGKSVEMWQPRSVLHWTGTDWVDEPTQLILKPAQPCGIGCVGNGNEEHLEVYSVEKVPYDYAIPVLTGWDMQYATTDHEIERIGIYLVEFDYVKDPNADTGTLNYTIFSTMRDDSDNGHYDPKYKVSILGFNTLGGGGSDK